MNCKRIIYICTFIVVLIVSLVAISSIMSQLDTNRVKVGVVDTNMSEDYMLQYDICNIMNATESIINNTTHADMVVDVIKKQDDNCEIYLANVLNDENTGNISNVIKALDWLKENEVDVVCMSLTTFEDSEQLQTAISDAQCNGIIVVAACLNYSNEITYPAMYDNVISVANCSNEHATVCILDKKIKDKLKKTQWRECSTSALTAYITGEISKQMSKGKFKLDVFIQKYNME